MGVAFFESAAIIAANDIPKTGTNWRVFLKKK